MKIKHVYGNVLKLDIPLTVKIVTLIDGHTTEREEPFYPDPTKPVVVEFANKYSITKTYNASVSENVVHIEDMGEVSVGLYRVTVKCFDELGNPYRYMARDVIDIVDATADAGIEAGVEFESETYTLEGAVFISYGGLSVQSDWNEDDPESLAFIKNKPDLSVYATKEDLEHVEDEIPTLPDNIVTDADYVHTDNNFSDQDKHRLNDALIEEQDPTVPQWAKSPTKPTYTASEVGALPDDTHLFSGDYQDLSNKPDLSLFITASVDDLLFYYLKSETYTKSEVQGLIAAIHQFHYEIYTSISDITDPQGNVLYLIGESGSGSDKYEEYVYANNEFVKIGDTSIDLSGYVTTTALNTTLANYSTTAQMNTAISSALNTALAEYSTTSQMTTAIAQALVSYYTKNEVDSLIANFITASVNNLVNYYLKTDTYSKLEVDTLISAVKQFRYEVVAELPAASAITMGIIYLVPSTNPKTSNVKNEYITIATESQGVTSYGWEQIGSTEIDLSDYPTTQQMNAAISSALAYYSTTEQINTAITSALSSYYTKTEANALVASEKSRAELEEGALRQLYENLTQSDIVVVEDHTAVSSPSVNIIYREQGNTSYIDWMWYNSAWKKMAEYDNGVDDEPVKDSDNFVKSGGVFKYTSQLAGEPSTFYQFELDMTNDKMIRPNGNVDGWTGLNRATSDLIDISEYAECDIYVMFAGSWNDSLGYALYKENGTFISGKKLYDILNWTKIAITSDTKYIRVSSTSANINNIALYAMKDSSASYQTIKETTERLNLIVSNAGLEKSTTIYGEDDSHNLKDTGSWVGAGYFVKIPTGIYTKLKFYVNANSTITVNFYAYNNEVGRVIVCASETLTNTTEARALIEKDVFLDLADKQRLCMDITNIGAKYDSSAAQYPGIPLYIGTLGNILTAEAWDACAAFGSGVKYDYSFSIEYLVSSNYEDDAIVRSIKTSKFFRGKKYVAYGDSIMATAGGVTAGTYVIPNLIGKFFNLTTINRGASGSHPIGSSNLSDANLAYVDADTMLVTISGGQNSWVTAEDINSTDRATSIGAINYYIDQIRTISPKCVIVLCPTYIGNGTSQCAIDYQRIADNKHVGLAPTLDLNLINWEYDKTSQQLRYDNIHPTEYGAIRFAAVCTHYLENFML